MGRKRGFKVSEKTKIKMRETHKIKNWGFKRGHKINNGNKNPNYGKKFSEDIKKKMSKSHKGLIRSEETRKKMSESHKEEKNPNWKGGISESPYPSDWTDDLRESIRKRDNYICQLCGIHQDELNRKLAIHHIDYNKNNLNPNNLITLCINCHMKTNYNRNYWIKYFNIS